MSPISSILVEQMWAGLRHDQFASTAFMHNRSSSLPRVRRVIAGALTGFRTASCAMRFSDYQALWAHRVSFPCQTVLPEVSCTPA